jgi:uncharacterized cupredoxin-like copper-binding protein
MHKVRKRQLAGLIIPTLVLGWATAIAAHEQHSGCSAGEPGNPKKPAREIVVEMSEMDYSPSVIKVKRGEQIRFVIRNVGTEDHEFLLASKEDNLKHAAAMKKNRIWSTTIRMVCASLPKSPRRFSGNSASPARLSIRA